MTRKPEDIRTAIDTTLSGASHDPTLYNRVVNASKGDPPTVKRKLTLSMALVLILVLMTGTVAVAATYKGVSWFFDTFKSEETIDPAYLMDSLEQHHDSELLNIRVVDAYWNGVELSMVFNFAPADPAADCVLCSSTTLAHRCNDTAELRIHTGEDINITTGTKITRPYWRSYSHVTEADGSLSLMITFNVNDMSKPVAITLPVQTTVRSTGATESALLHCYLPVMADPIAPHEHDWTESTCVSPKVCRICGRTDGKLGDHNFIRATCIKPSTCTVCGTEQGTLSLHHQYGDDGHCILCNKYYEHADKTK